MSLRRSTGSGNGGGGAAAWICARGLRARLVLPATLVAVGLTWAVSVSAHPPLAADVTIQPSGLGSAVANDEDVLVYAPGGSALATTLPPIPAAAGLNAYTTDGNDVLFALDSAAEIAGVLVETRDVARWDGGQLTLEVDGSAAGIPDGLRIDAVAFSIATGNLLLSVDSSALVGAVHVDDEDLFRPAPTPLLIFDGSAEGIDEGLDLVGFDLLTATDGLFSFDGSGQVDSIDFDDEDLLAWSFTTGDFSLYLDGSSLDPAWSTADVRAVPEPSTFALWAVGVLALCGLTRSVKRPRAGAETDVFDPSRVVEHAVEGDLGVRIRPSASSAATCR